MPEQKSGFTMSRGGATGSGFGTAKKLAKLAKVKTDRENSEKEEAKRADKARAKPEGAE